MCYVMLVDNCHTFKGNTWSREKPNFFHCFVLIFFKDLTPCSCTTEVLSPNDVMKLLSGGFGKQKLTQK